MQEGGWLLDVKQTSALTLLQGGHRDLPWSFCRTFPCHRDWAECDIADCGGGGSQRVNCRRDAPETSSMRMMNKTFRESGC